MQPIFKMAVATALAVGLMGGSPRADLVHVSGVTSGQSVNVAYTGGSRSTTAGAFGLTGKAGDLGAAELPPGDSLTIDAYCASLDLSISPPVSFALDAVLTLNALTGGAGTHFVNTLYTADVGNRLAFLLNTYGGVTNSDANVRAALQLAVWNTIDKNFQITSTPPAAVVNLYNQYTGWLTNGYDAFTVYNSNAKFFLTPKLNTAAYYQNLIGLVPGTDDTHVVPEPSSVAIVLGLVGLGVVGRLRARRKTA